MSDKTLNIKALLPNICALAQEAGEAIMVFYHGDSNATTKSDGSCVTDADTASETIILKKLKELTPNIPIVSEEAVAAGDHPDVSGGTFWTVDPLDGTSLFINKEDGFSVLIGLVIDNKPEMGVIYHPKTGILYHASGPNTATCVSPDGTSTNIITRDIPKNGGSAVLNKDAGDLTKIYNFLSKNTKKENKYELDGKPLTKFISNTSLYDFCHIADGSVDALAHVSKTKGDGTNWWDIVPGHALVNAAGGCIKTFDNSDIIYSAKAGHFRVPPFIAKGRDNIAHKDNITKKLQPNNKI